MKLRLALLAVLTLAACLAGPATAATPAPIMPLPPCEDDNGNQTGACPQTNENVTGSAGGRLSAEGSAIVSTDPTLPVCDHHNGYPPYPWSPSPCWSAVHKPVVVSCGYIDLENDGVWRESSCANALYRETSQATYPMFTVDAAPDSAGCGGAGAYGTYVYGGPANDPPRKWVNRGPTLLDCRLTFNGARPNGMRGPTWVKLRVGIDRAENGDERRGYAEYAQMYVPIDGDLREDAIDVDVLASASVRQEGDAQIVTFDITLTNEGEKAAEGVRLVPEYVVPASLTYDGVEQHRSGIPPQLHLISHSGPEGKCVTPDSKPFVGGGFTCNDLKLEAADDSLGRNTELFEIEARIVNAADLPPITFKAIVPDDVFEDNNEDRVNVNTGVSNGSIEATRQAMAALDAHFDYQTDTFGSQCNIYMQDIVARLERIRLDHPEVFDNLSYGTVTSGRYYTAVGSEAGHVGVVVYAKGTDYHQSGIVIHGTPSQSPIGAAPENFDTQVGPFPLGEVPDSTRVTGTYFHGYYYRTPVGQFPGEAIPEKPGCGFEGLYADNADSFARPRAGGCGAPAASCPIAPNALVVTTESPVEVRATNTRGQRVETLDGGILHQELDTRITSMAFPHADGTFGWTLVLPPDDYALDLIGSGTGPYRLTMTRFDQQGMPQNEVVDGMTEPGQIDQFVFDETLFSDSFEAASPAGRR